LVIQSLDFETTGKDALSSQRSCYVSLPLLKGKNQYDFDKLKGEIPGFNHTTLTCTVEVRTQNATASNYFRLYHNEKGETPLRVQVLKDHFSIDFDNRLITDLGAAVMGSPPSPSS
jgi:hypothetical protein